MTSIRDFLFGNTTKVSDFINKNEEISKRPEVDVICIGDTVVDEFIKLQDAEVHTDIKTHEKTISLKFGQKIPYEEAIVLYGVGNSANAAVSFSRLGLKSLLLTEIGKDQSGEKIKEVLKAENINLDFIGEHVGIPTNDHYVLWYKDERTILVKHFAYPRVLDEKNLPKAKYCYLSSLGSDTLEYQEKIASWLERNPQTKLIFQPGTFQMQVGVQKLKKFYELSYIFVCNVEEAKLILGNINLEIKDLLKKMHLLGPEIVCITDGPNGAYLYNKGKAYFMPIYPDIAPPYERTGAGDSFTSTFASAIALGLTPEQAMTWGPINSMSVVQYVGAQEGLLTKTEILEYLKNAPTDYKLREI
jgi:sugar/nucleoside kinase (ribokinase family)